MVRGPCSVRYATVRRSSQNRFLIGSPVGYTLNYAPPEQLDPNRIGEVGPHSDVYSFGQTCRFALFKKTQPSSRAIRGLPEPWPDHLDECCEQEINSRPKDFATVLNRLGISREQRKDVKTKSRDKCRRFPIYLLVHCSHPMNGEIKEAIGWLHADMLGDPFTIETAWISVITFAKNASQTVELTEVLDFRVPQLPTDVHEATALGAAIRALNRSLDRDVRLPTPTEQGDHRAIAFVLIANDPTDDWVTAARAVLKCGDRGLKGIHFLVAGSRVPRPSSRRDIRW